jgi:formamidopyrimidine-DNA glycosylase
MPELPEVEALADFLREHASGRVIARAEAASFAVLKTFDPPLSALSGRVIGDVARHGKFLDLSCGVGSDAGDGGDAGDLHLVMHLARAGWLRWRDDIPDKPARPGKSPLAFRLVLSDGSGFDLTEAGTQKRLAVYLVRDPADVPGVASLGPEPLADDFTVDALAAILAGRRTQIKGVLRDQHIIAGIGNAYSDEVLNSRARRRPGCGCTGRQASRARPAATRSARSPSRIRRCSTARPARPAASRWPTGGCRGC